MRRGVLEITRKELNMLLQRIDKSLLPDLTINKLQIKPAENIDTMRIFLSEDEAESLLDSINISKFSLDHKINSSYKKLQEFLSNLRYKS